ncbi:hypothetical protein FRB99_008038 [Tulasnella sp. 403]|nr:hypothetical protein FRB99_008038 [Tulasnella sp. 403]
MSTTRSRTNLFLSIRASSVRPRRRYTPSTHDNSEEHSHLLSDDQPHLAIDVPPNWYRYPYQIKYKPYLRQPAPKVSGNVSTPPSCPFLGSVRQSQPTKLIAPRCPVSTLDKLHAKHVLPGFADRTAEEREIESLTTDITRDFRKAQSLIQQIDPHTTFPPPTRHELLAAQNVQRGLAAKVQDLSDAFRKKQRVYMQKLQGHAIKNQDLLIASGAVSLKGGDRFAALEEDVEASRSQLTTQQLIDTTPDVDTRTREITEIAKSIASLAELFKDLSTLVIEQGTILDSVEYNIEQTVFRMEDAVKDLDVATRRVILLLGRR